jgi:PPM family protein phosphatase
MNLNGALEIVSLSDPGKVRSHNEDFVAERSEIGLVVLADGMGGYNAGEVASGMAARIVVEGLGAAWHKTATKAREPGQWPGLAHQMISQQIERANWAIFQKAQNEAQCAGMGTTLVTGLFHDNRLTVGHIGDSRLYRLRGEKLEQVTKDHSLLQEQIDNGTITKEEAKLSRNKNLLTRALGIDPEVQAEINTYLVEPQDLYLLCSDGLNDMLEDEEIRLTLLTLQMNLTLAARQLVQSANDSGGRDNVSVVLVKVLKPYPAQQQNWWLRLRSWLKL